MPDTPKQGAGQGSSAPAVIGRVEDFRRMSVAALQPLLAESLKAGLKSARGDDTGQQDVAAELSVLLGGVIEYERRWLREINAAFAGWPELRAARARGFSLLSNEELGSQLIGDPVVLALEHRFKDVLDHVGSRLRSVAAELGHAHRPVNPVAPRVLVEAFLRVVPSTDCSPEARQAVLDAFEAQCASRLGEFYNQLNVQLAGAGHAVQASMPDMLDARNQVGFGEGGQTRGARGHAARSHKPPKEESERVRALRRWADRNGAAGGAREDGRVLSDNEFLAVVSLLQSEVQGGAAPKAPRLQDRIQLGAASLGINPETVSLSDAQSQVTHLVDRLIEGLLAAHDFDEAATDAFSGLALPLCRETFLDPSFFDGPGIGHPAVSLLDQMAWALDANAEAAPDVVELREAALRAARLFVTEQQDPDLVFKRAAAGMQMDTEAVRNRQALASRRAVQAVEGRVRLDEARLAIDAALQELVGERRLLPVLAEFLAGPWRQAATAAWLREGTGSERLGELRDVAQDLVEVDSLAAAQESRVVADRILGIEQVLRSVVLDEQEADRWLAVIVHALANPDAERDLASPDRRRATGPTTSIASVQDGDGASIAEVGDGLTWRTAEGSSRVEVAWKHGGSAHCLLLTRTGRRATREELVDLAPLQAAGQLRRHRAHGAVEDLLQAWLAEESGNEP